MLPTMLITSLFASSLLEYIEFIYSEIHLIRWLSDTKKDRSLSIFLENERSFTCEDCSCRRYSYCSVHSFFASRTIPALCFRNRILIHSYFFVTVQKSHPGFSFLLHDSKSLPFFSVSAASFYQIRKKAVHLRRWVDQPFRMPSMGIPISFAARPSANHASSISGRMVWICGFGSSP